MKSLILFFILLLITFNEQLKTEDEILIYDKYYYKFSEVQNSLKNINYKIDKNLDLVEINGNNKKINFLLNSNYYSLGDYVFTSYTRNKYINNELYISDEVLSCILNNLISEDYSKTKNINKIFLKIYKKIHITAEEISLKNIIIDAGHGGYEYGASGIIQEHEKYYNLEISKLLKKVLKKKFPSLNIILIRNNDDLISLEDRSNQSIKHLQVSKNTIFLSIHCNSVKGKDINPNGFEVYYLDQNEDSEDQREKKIIEEKLLNVNRPNIIQKIHSNLYLSVVQRRSSLLANSVEAMLKENLRNRIQSRGVKRANFHVLRRNYMPSILLEVGFITNEEDLKIIANRDMQFKIVQGIIEGIKLYAERKDN
jgi:N-acetylmuramoyl-L-alanine amidase